MWAKVSKYDWTFDYLERFLPLKICTFIVKCGAIRLAYYNSNIDVTCHFERYDFEI